MIKKIRNRVKSLKLWQKLLLLYLVVSVIPLLALSLFSAYNTTDLVRSQVSTRLSEITGSIGENISRKIDIVDSIVDSELYGDSFLKITENCASLPGNSQNLNAVLQEMHGKLNAYFGDTPEIQFYLPDGSVIGTDHTGPAADFKTADYLFGNNQHRYITCDGDNVAVYYRTVDFYHNSESTGIVKICIPSASFIGKLSLSGIDQYIFVIQNRSGKTLYLHSNTTNNYGDIVLNLLHKTESNIIYIRNEAYIFHPLLLESADWNLCLLMPRSVLYQNFSEMLGYYILLSALCLVIVSVFSVLSSLNMSKRINNISSEMSLISDGEIEMKVDIDTTGDEIGQLSILFHQMMERINSLVIEQYKSEIKLHEEQLKILQNQINPHFLYNCMDTINWRCILNNDTRTSNFANNLADFYRTCLNKGNTRICLSDEFKNIRSYIYLQLDMHDNSFTYEEKINPQIYEYEGINLMLQPIVENALEHGLELSEQQSSLLFLAGDFDNDQRTNIRIEVYNSGTPIDPQVAAAVMRGEKGYGLTNVTNRIHLYFGQQYGVTIGPDQDGTKCVITIPARRWDDHE